MKNLNNRKMFYQKILMMIKLKKQRIKIFPPQKSIAQTKKLKIKRIPESLGSRILCGDDRSLNGTVGVLH